MEINNYLDATYLKTAEQAGITEEETLEKVMDLLDEAITYHYKLVMIRSKFIPAAKSFLTLRRSKTLIGTVIGFHEGTYGISEKMKEAERAIALGADELDFVINYPAFQRGDLNLVRDEVEQCTGLGLSKSKTVKWIIETAALNDEEIIEITKLIRDIVVENFTQEDFEKVYVKSSTGFYKTEKGKANGATFENMKLIAANARPLKIKAAGGVRDYETAVKMVALGVDRIGTSSSKEICTQTPNAKSGY